MSAELQVQGGIYSALTGSAALMAAVSGVFDDVPVNYDLFPFVTIGEDTSVQWDTDKGTGSNVTVNIHVWSRFKGHEETKTIQGLIYNALHNATLVYTGYNSVLCQQRAIDSFMDPDGITRHGFQTFNVLIQKQ